MTRVNVSVKFLLSHREPSARTHLARLSEQTPSILVKCVRITWLSQVQQHCTDLGVADFVLSGVSSTWSTHWVPATQRWNLVRRFSFSNGKRCRQSVKFEQKKRTPTNTSLCLNAYTCYKLHQWDHQHPQTFTEKGTPLYKVNYVCFRQKHHVVPTKATCGFEMKHLDIFSC